MEIIIESEFIFDVQPMIAFESYPSLFLFCPTSEQTNKKSLIIPSHGAGKEVQTMQVTVSKVNPMTTLSPNHHKNESHLPFPLLELFQTGLEARFVLPRQLHYVSNTTFRASSVCVASLTSESHLDRWIDFIRGREKRQLAL